VLGLLVLSHGDFAEELVNAARTIVEDATGLEAVSIGWNEAVTECNRKIDEAVGRVDQGQGVLVLTDMFGGTPTNLALSLLEAGRIEIVTGVNLPMLIKFTNLRGEMTLPDAARAIAAQGREAIHVASELLESSGAEAPGSDG
jgi:PTS system mannose-specific IIA component